MKKDPNSIRSIISNTIYQIGLILSFYGIITFVSFLSFKFQISTYVSLGFELLGVSLLFVDDKYKMDRNKLLYGKWNTFFLSLDNNFDVLLFYLKILRKKIFVMRKNCGSLKLELYATKINHDYPSISDARIREEEMLKSFESDLRMLRYFSQVRRYAYLFLALGFIFQFISHWF